MESNTSDAHTSVEPGPSMAVPSAVEKPLQIRWGRTFLALGGLLALLTAGISGALERPRPLDTTGRASHLLLLLRLRFCAGK